jgi:hypothetical protein
LPAKGDPDIPGWRQHEQGHHHLMGLVHNYYANIFGAPQYKELHDKLANDLFQTAFAKGLFVGQMRTRLGIDGYETSGPEDAAKALFEQISRM